MYDRQDQVSVKIHEDIKKINTIKLWTKISKKYFEIFETKRRRQPTINAVQNFKDILVQAKYPQNSVYNKILQLESKAK